MLTLTGTMLQSIRLASTPLKLNRGQRVYLTFPDNQPNPLGKWFARPLNGVWADGVERSDEDSILLDEGDYEIDPVTDDSMMALVAHYGPKKVAKLIVLVIA